MRNQKPSIEEPQAKKMNQKTKQCTTNTLA